ncbi:LysR family transcriptional regulator [Duganella aceris]|jgi:DNA-binding transcriptional LysR family regulator|uniref:LysR family transcriptional regulator n=1 Tax=Duganella aceris TaxID=2703883 RepID=A0ABX0FPL8_9BURK|nr:LysR substrate-binding domain-containing protein [Duganella aceris]NGZ86480.1 LysR family transcriptional regulator [Duganella aceris]
MFIRQLEYLVALAELGHFSRAADACHVSQPALSSAIAKLEQELDLQLVRRGRNYEGLTDEGRRVVGWAQHMLSSYEAMRQEAVDANRTPTGTLRIGAIPTAMPVVPFLTAGCHERYRGIKLTILSLPSDEIVRRLDNCDLDLGLTFLDGNVLAGFQVHPLFQERYVLVARDPAVFGGRSALSWAQAAELDLCLLTANMQSRQIIDAAFRSVAAKPRIQVETDSIFALYAQVRFSDLCAVVPHSVLSLIELRQELSIVPLLPQLSRQIGLVLREQDPLPAVTAAVLQLALQVPLQARFDGLISDIY